MSKKKLDFCIGIFDNLTDKGIAKIKEDIQNCEIYGIGVYTDEMFEKVYGRKPLKPYAEREQMAKRMATAENIEGVKFVFKLDSSDSSKLKEIIKNETMKYINDNKQ